MSEADLLIPIIFKNISEANINTSNKIEDICRSFLEVDLDQITTEEAAKIEKFRVFGLSLNGTSLTTEVADFLAKYSGASMAFFELKEMTNEVADALSRAMVQELEFHALTRITPEMAEAFCRSNVKRLGLDGLTEITPEAARILSKFKGKSVSLLGLQNPTPEVIEIIKESKVLWTRFGTAKENRDRLTDFFYDQHEDDMIKAEQ